MIMLLNFATKASELEGDKSVIAGLELLTLFQKIAVTLAFLQSFGI